MGPRADSHDDVYDRQIRLWGADAQVRIILFGIGDTYYLIMMSLVTYYVIWYILGPLLYL